MLTLADTRAPSIERVTERFSLSLKAAVSEREISSVDDWADSDSTVDE
jgi:hypothetical protein